MSSAAYQNIFLVSREPASLQYGLPTCDILWNLSECIDEKQM